MKRQRSNSSSPWIIQTSNNNSTRIKSSMFPITVTNIYQNIKTEMTHSYETNIDREDSMKIQNCPKMNIPDDHFSKINQLQQQQQQQNLDRRPSSQKNQCYHRTTSHTRRNGQYSSVRWSVLVSAILMSLCHSCIVGAIDPLDATSTTTKNDQMHSIRGRRASGLDKKMRTRMAVHYEQMVSSMDEINSTPTGTSLLNYDHNQDDPTTVSMVQRALKGKKSKKKDKKNKSGKSKSSTKKSKEPKKKKKKSRNLTHKPDLSSKEPATLPPTIIGTKSSYKDKSRDFCADNVISSLIDGEYFSAESYPTFLYLQSDGVISPSTDFEDLPMRLISIFWLALCSVSDDVCMDERITWEHWVPENYPIFIDFCDDVNAFLERFGYGSLNPSISALPSIMPSSEPSEIPPMVPTSIPSTKPSLESSSVPSMVSSHLPSLLSSSMPSKVESENPSLLPSSLPSSTPSLLTSGAPSVTATSSPSILSSQNPSEVSSSEPSNVGSVTPSSQYSNTPSVNASPSPSLTNSQGPSSVPSLESSNTPSIVSSTHPSEAFSSEPSVYATTEPTNKPSQKASVLPSQGLSERPTLLPSMLPSKEESVEPSVDPSTKPTSFPSKALTKGPSSKPTTVYPSSIPSIDPRNVSESPSTIPSEMSSVAPTVEGSTNPSLAPSNASSTSPSIQSSSAPTVTLSSSPSVEASSVPTYIPSAEASMAPTVVPTVMPSTNPTNNPTEAPSHEPSFGPSVESSSIPTITPTLYPSVLPSLIPSYTPTSSDEPSVIPTYSPSTMPTITRPDVNFVYSIRYNRTDIVEALHNVTEVIITDALECEVNNEVCIEYNFTHHVDITPYECFEEPIEVDKDCALVWTKVYLTSDESSSRKDDDDMANQVLDALKLAIKEDVIEGVVRHHAMRF